MFKTLLGLARDEAFLILPIAACLVFLTDAPAVAGLLGTATECAVLFAILLGSCLAVTRHADHLAARMGEPYGTLILTLAVTMIEVTSISALMTHGDANPALVRDTIFSVVMIVLNLMVGLSLLLGAWRHVEQAYNLQGANTYLGTIFPLTVLSLIMPNFTTTTPGPTLSSAQERFVAIVSLGLYAVFVGVQTMRHRAYFRLGGGDDGGDDSADHAAAPGTARHPALHGLLLAAYMIPLVYLAEALARPVETLLHGLAAPAALGGLIIAVLVATPEALGAIKAARADQVQRSMNICLGSVLSTIGLTIPAMIVLSQIMGQKITLGLENANSVLLLLTLAVSLITFASGRTNVLQGAVHLVMFGTYILLVFQQ